MTPLAGALRWLVLRAIGGYRRWLSPVKGYRCAYAACTGRASCSLLGFRAVRRHGALRGLAVIQERLMLCGVAHHRHRPAAAARPVAGQRGDCDLGCDLPGDSACDLPSGKTCRGALDCADVLNCADCDWRRRKQPERKGRKGAGIHLPGRPPGADGA